jgi:hypothetical protein
MKWFWDTHDEFTINHERRRFVFVGAAAGLVAVTAPKLLLPSDAKQIDALNTVTNPYWLNSPPSPAVTLWDLYASRAVYAENGLWWPRAKA